MGSQRSKEDAVQKISTSVFVTNFPDQSSAKDMWNACKQYGYVVDAFIHNRRSKVGKRFGFVRFIKVFDVVRLVNNLCTVWIGRHRIHVNVARFQRASLNNSSNEFSYNREKRNNTSDVSKDKGTKDTSNSYAHVVKGRPPLNREVDSNPALVLDESCLNLQDYSRCLMGKVKDFGSLSNLKVVLGSEGFDNIDIRYLGGYWVMIDFVSEEVKKKFQSNVGIGTWFSQLHQASNDFTIDRRVTWVELEGIPLKLWFENTFKRIASKWGVLLHVDDPGEGCFYRKRLCITTTDLEGDNEMNAVPDTLFEKELSKSNGGEASVGQSEMQPEDPFNIYTLLNKKKEDNKKGSSTNDSLKYPLSFTPREDVETDVEQSNQRNGFVREIGEEVNDSVGNSGGILCVWDTNSFNATVSDYFVMIRGEVIIMGDFNKDRNKNERFGSVFNVQGANAFNSFSSSAGLEEVPRSLKIVDGFDKLVKETWFKAHVDTSNAMLNLMKKLKYLKTKIRAWNNDMRKTLKTELDKLQSLEAAQKAKIKWAIKRDENSKYYHGILNKKRNQLSIRGVLADGIWIDNPASVKNEFLSHFKNWFEIPQEARLNMNMDFPCKLTSIQQSDLEIKVSKE
ncbi:RNA-directed DNA polymerase, eukaryota, reverse transcriptase zinc-binding domain protein [Tanacetum coccineum]